MKSFGRNIIGQLCPIDSSAGASVTQLHPQKTIFRMDQIYKLQPHRTMHLQGFDDYGTAAVLWRASDNGFTVSGVFHALADLAVLVLLQMDDPFGHPLFSYSPDGELRQIGNNNHGSIERF
jgi:hypothetical protein